MNNNSNWIDEPETEAEILKFHNLREADPQGFIRIADQWILQNPKSSYAYFSRHNAWMNIGQPHRALDDLNKAIEFEPDQVSFCCRGSVYRHLGDYQNAMNDFDRAEAIDPEQWEADAVGLLYQADVHARLGDVSAALACCDRLPDDFWTPGLQGAPAGDKAQIAGELRRIAAGAARRSK